MARNVRASTFETRTSRLKRLVARKPEYVRIAPGIGLGYRRNATRGSWVVRVSDGSGGYWTKVLGWADDYDEADGDSILTYWQAQDRAKTSAALGKDHVEIVPPPPSPEHEATADAEEIATLRSVINAYEANLRARGGSLKNAQRIRAHMSEKMLDRPISALKASELQKWRDALTVKRRRKPGSKDDDTPSKPMEKAGKNRLCTALKAALNLHADLEGTESRHAWTAGLKGLPEAETSENTIIPDNEIRNLLAEARKEGTDFGFLFESLVVTGARVSQVAKINVSDLQDGGPNPRLMVPVSKKGRGRKEIDKTPVPISADFAKRLREASEGKAPGDPLFPKGDGRWKDSDHSRPFNRVMEKVGLTSSDGESITSYALRHSNIVRALLANVPVRIVAAMHDTSVKMIEKNYSSQISTHADALARAAMIQLDDTEDAA